MKLMGDSSGNDNGLRYQRSDDIILQQLIKHFRLVNDTALMKEWPSGPAFGMTLP